MATEQEVTAETLKRIAPLSGRVPMPPATIAALKGRIPDTLLDLLETLGIGVWGDGLWQSVDPLRFDGILKLTLREDPDFNAADCTVIGLLGFGDLWCWHRRFGMMNFSVLHNELSVPNFVSPQDLDPTLSCLISFMVIPTSVGGHYDLYDSAGKGMFDGLVGVHGPLATGMIFAPRLHPALGGAMQISNFRPASALEAVALIHQMEPFILVDRSKPRAIDIRPVGPQG